jgi:hypothetical protein
MIFTQAALQQISALKFCRAVLVQNPKRIGEICLSLPPPLPLATAMRSGL